MSVRLAHVVSHPIQYFAHRYRHVAARPDVEFKVLFGSRMGLDRYFDKEFGQTFAWNMPILEGYESDFPGGKHDSDARGIWHALEAFNPDGVWIHGYSDQSVPMACKWAQTAWRWGRIHRRPVFLSGDSNIRKEFKKPLWKRLVKQAMMRLFFKSLTGVLTVGESNEAWYRYYGVARERMVRFPFTVDPALFDAAWKDRRGTRARFRARHGIPANACMALWCGKITPLKRPMDLLNALAANRAAGGPDVWALFAGDGALRGAVERRLAADRQPGVCAGFLNVDEVAVAYAAADLLVHTCDRESYGLVAVEAARMGLPMIVPASMGAVGATDAARPGVNARVFADGDAAELGRHLGALAADAALRARMGAASVRVYEELERHFTDGVGIMAGTCGVEGGQP